MAATPLYLEKTDFRGTINIQFGNEDDFYNLAYEIEQKYSKKLFGWEIAYILSGEPDAIKYRNITTGITEGYEDDSGVMRELAGFKEAVKYFFYYHYITGFQDARTLSGDPTEAYLKMVGGSKYQANKNIVNAWNQAVEYYNQIVDYMTLIEAETPDTYENWEYETLKEINTFGII